MNTYKIAVMSGAGPQSKGLAYRLAKAGHTAIASSRPCERARHAAADISRRIGEATQVSGANIATAAESPDVRSGIRIAGLEHAR